MPNPMKSSTINEIIERCEVLFDCLVQKIEGTPENKEQLETFTHMTRMPSAVYATCAFSSSTSLFLLPPPLLAGGAYSGFR